MDQETKSSSGLRPLQAHVCGVQGILPLSVTPQGKVETWPGWAESSLRPRWRDPRDSGQGRGRDEMGKPVGRGQPCPQHQRDQRKKQMQRAGHLPGRSWATQEKQLKPEAAEAPWTGKSARALHLPQHRRQRRTLVTKAEHLQNIKICHCNYPKHKKWEGEGATGPFSVALGHHWIGHRGSPL